MDGTERAQDPLEPQADVRALAPVPIFSDVAPEDLQTLASLTRSRTYDRGQLIVSPDDPRREVLIIAAGGTRAYRLSPGGHEITLEYVDGPDIFGLVFLHEDLQPRSFVVATVDDTVVYHVPPELFRAWMMAHPDVAVKAAALVSYRLAEARDRIADLAFYDVKARLAHTLARLVRGAHNQMVLSTHEELARMVGTRQEEVTKALRSLRLQRLVAYRPHQRGIRVLDVDALARYGTEVS